MKYELVPNAPLREAFEESDVSLAEMTRRMGFLMIKKGKQIPNTSHTARMLGLKPTSKGGYQEQISVQNAEKVVKALNLTPREYGI